MAELKQPRWTRLGPVGKDQIHAIVVHRLLRQAPLFVCEPKASRPLRSTSAADGFSEP